ncbi:MAG: VWA domain-containing protein [Kiritimatiellia bacterium]
MSAAAPSRCASSRSNPTRRSRSRSPTPSCSRTTPGWSSTSIRSARRSSAPRRSRTCRSRSRSTGPSRSRASIAPATRPRSGATATSARWSGLRGRTSDPTPTSRWSSRARPIRWASTWCAAASAGATAPSCCWPRRASPRRPTRCSRRTSPSSSTPPGRWPARRWTRPARPCASALANLGAEDRFEIVRFSTEAEPLFNGLQPADKEHLDKAGAFVDGLKPIGGTAIGEALEKALALRKGDGTRPFHVIFLTDGLPTIGETREDPLVDAVKKANGANTRIFAFGIGTDVNTHLLDRIASETRAASQYVLPAEDLEIKLSSFYTKIAQPVLSGLSLEFTNPEVRVTQMHPNTLPDLFNGDLLVVFGRYAGHGPAAVKIKGVFNGKPHEFTADVKFAEMAAGNDYIPMLWATRRVGWLLDEIRLRGESAELKDEVTKLAREYGIVTPYTAYLILEDERRRDVPVAQRNFRELEADRPAVEFAARKMASLDREAKREESRSGEDAVFNSLDVGDLAGASAPVQAEGGAFKGRGGGYNAMPKSVAAASPAPGEKLGYRASQTQAYAQQAKVVNGRSFYQNGNVWNDSTAQNRKNLRQVNIAFNSDAYFDLLRKHPEAAPWFSLGNEVDIVIEDTLYQVRGS